MSSAGKGREKKDVEVAAVRGGRGGELLDHLLVSHPHGREITRKRKDGSRRKILSFAGERGRGDPHRV